jgi:hypothetical protein
MHQHYPSAWNFYINSPDVKKVLWLQYEGVGSCPNCGGSGVVSVFLATAGPFDSPGSSNYVSKWFDGKWWCAPSFDSKKPDESLHFGTFSADCPDCRGEHAPGHGVYVPMPDEVRLALNAVLDRKRVR